MIKLNKWGRQTAIIAALLIVLAVLCRMLGKSGFYPFSTGLIRSGIYIFLFIAWGASLGRRIIQGQLRGYMIGIAGSMTFWFLVRTLKYHFIPAETMPTATRLAWYAYYIPMLMIPMLSLFAAVSLGKPEQYRLPRVLHLLWIPTSLLLLTVLSNDLHRTVFTFPQEYPIWSDDHYSYGPMYAAVMLWILFCAALALGIVIFKCRIPHSKKILWLPLIVFCLLITYSVLCVTAWSVIKPFLGDLTATSCVLITVIFESCIQCGLIQSNSHYTELFMASTVAAQITDQEYRVFVSSDAAQPVSAEQLCKAQTAPVMLSGDRRFSCTPICGGYIFWQEDVSELVAVLKALADTRDELQGYSHLLDEENRQKKRRRELEERKRLFAAVQCKVLRQVKLMEELHGRLQNTEDIAEAKMLHGKITIIGAYLKRRSNLIFLADQTGRVEAREMFLCLNESVSNLRLAGVSCAVQFDLEGSMEGEAAGILYDFFEAVTEAVYEKLPGMNVAVTLKEAGVHILLMLKCSADLSAVSQRFTDAIIEQDEDVCYCRLIVQEGGASV